MDSTVNAATSSQELLDIIKQLKKWDFSHLKTLAQDHNAEIAGLYDFSKELFELVSGVKNDLDEIDEQTQKVFETNRERAEAARGIMSANESIATGAARQAEYAEECSALANSFQDRFEVMMDSSRELSEKAENAGRISQEGETAIQKLFERSRESQQILSDIIERLQALGNSVRSIEKISQTIDRISDQTNLLAVNASIEAARAGEAGRGFAVVAQEVTRLARDTKKSLDNINTNVAQVISEVAAAEKLSETAQHSYTELNESIARTNDSNSNIHAALQEFEQKQTQVYDYIESLFDEKNRLVQAVEQIAEEVVQSAATSQMVASLTMEQSNVDDMITDMIQSLGKLSADAQKRLSRVKIEHKTKDKKKIAFITLEQQGFYNEVVEAAIKTGRKLDLEVLAKAPARYDVNQQAAIFEEFVDQKVDGIIVVPSDAARFSRLIDQAAGRGIRVACVDVDVPGSKRNIFITSDSYKGGQIAGESTVRHLKGKGRILVLLCASEVPTVKKRYQGFMDYIKRNSDIEVIETREQADTDMAKTRRIIEEMIRQHPDFDLIYFVTGDAGEVAMDIWQEKRLSQKIVVLSKSDKLTQGVKAGIISSEIAQRNELWGEMGVKMMNKIFRGERVAEYHDTGMYEINQANVAIFEKNR